MLPSPLNNALWFFVNKLCVTLNDIEYMRLWLKKLPESLAWEDVINAMMVAHGERGGKHARTALENMLSSSDEDMLNKVAVAIEHIGQQVCCDFYLFWSPSIEHICHRPAYFFLLIPGVSCSSVVEHPN